MVEEAFVFDRVSAGDDVDGTGAIRAGAGVGVGVDALSDGFDDPRSFWPMLGSSRTVGVQCYIRGKNVLSV